MIVQPTNICHYWPVISFWLDTHCCNGSSYHSSGIRNRKVKLTTCILKVNIDCKGCARKVTKQLQKIKGVYSVRIDAEEQGKVIVAGNVDPAILIKKLNKSGKHAVLWDDDYVDDVQLQQRESMNVIYNPQNYPINNNNYILQVDDNKNNNSKGGRKNEKSQNQKGQKGGDGQGHIVAHFQNLKVPHHQNKQHKAVTFKNNLPDDEFDSSDHFHDDEDDDSSDEEEEGYSHGPPIAIDNNNNNYKKVMPMMRNGLPSAGQMTTEPVKLMNNHNHSHKGNANGGNYGSVIEKKNGKTSNGGVVGRLKSFGKKNKKGEGVIYNGIIQDKKGHGKLGGGHGNLNSNSKNDHDFDFHDNMPSRSVNGNMGPMGNNKNGGGGYQQHQGVQMQYAPSYNIEQMEMMMNQRKQQQQQQQQQHQHQHMMMNQREQQQANMYPQPAPSMMMYDSQQPNNYYMPPPMPSHPRADPITHSLSDENPNACTIM